MFEYPSNPGLQLMAGHLEHQRSRVGGKSRGVRQRWVNQRHLTRVQSDLLPILFHTEDSLGLPGKQEQFLRTPMRNDA